MLGRELTLSQLQPGQPVSLTILHLFFSQVTPLCLPLAIWQLQQRKVLCKEKYLVLYTGKEGNGSAWDGNRGSFMLEEQQLRAPGPKCSDFPLSGV